MLFHFRDSIPSNKMKQDKELCMLVWEDYFCSHKMVIFNAFGFSILWKKMSHYIAEHRQLSALTKKNTIHLFFLTEKTINNKTFFTTYNYITSTYLSQCKRRMENPKSKEKENKTYNEKHFWYRACQNQQLTHALRNFSQISFTHKHNDKNMRRHILTQFQ